MSDSGSISALLECLKEGDDEAVRRLWERYSRRLVALAKKKLQGAPLGVADEDDAANSAFYSFCRRAAQGQFPNLKDRTSLWALLMKLTAHKAADLLRRFGREKRPRPPLPPAESDNTPTDLDDIPGDELTPFEEVIMKEAFEVLLARLRDPVLRRVAVWKFEDFTNAEIATKLGCAVATVERRLKLIRMRWGKELPAATEPDAPEDGC